MNRELTVKAGSHVPVEAGFWVLIFGDLVVFGAMFVAFMLRRFESPETYQVFVDGSQSLNQGVGLINTLVLLTSSFFVARAVILYRSGKPSASANALLSGLALSLLFVFFKLFEYVEKINAGIGVTSSRFYEFYFTFTGIHLMHVLIGACLLTWLRSRCKQEAANGSSSSIGLLEGVGVYWHMVDLLWLLLFSLFYLVP
ncbi:cytochrome c oxidase subunit 3 [Zhongshania arctica]|uniref:Cytochrome c oxidase subunit 3 n=1 Tax=Zhongshania arctica TaxID=3238302 RepID=A0ABV3TZH8_9GAMM|tara:strand:- start:9318 stop:9914 length:597 start_codon:yes stop_codon:yes gene_type:complete